MNTDSTSPSGPLGRPSVRPIFAAVVFGLLALLLILFAALVLTSKEPPRGVAAALSALSPCAPFLYLATRGFRHNRRDAFESMPQRGCLITALMLLVFGALLGHFGGSYALTAGPAIAAFVFAMCYKPFATLAGLLGAA